MQSSINARDNEPPCSVKRCGGLWSTSGTPPHTLRRRHGLEKQTPQPWLGNDLKRRFCNGQGMDVSTVALIIP